VLPANSALYVATGCWACEGYHTGIQRITTNGNGTSTVEAIPEPPLLPGEQRTDLAMAPDGSLIVAVICTGENCGPLGQVQPGTTSRVVMSTDDGRSWAALAQYDTFASITLGPKGRILVAWSDPNPATPPTLTLLNPPGAVSAPAGDTYPLFLADGTLAWLDRANATVLAGDGSTLLSFQGLLTLRGQLGDVRALPDGTFLVGWYDSGSASGGPTTTFYAHLDAAGNELWRRSVDRSDALYLTAVWSTSAALGIIQTPDAQGQLRQPVPVAIDLERGQIQPLGDLWGTAPFLGRNYPVALRTGPFLVVATDGDCLNLRESPSASATSLGCFRDGVLLTDIGDSTTAGGVTWRHVRTASGAIGWASADFLSRP
jgi:hypothetical protein